jgi:hypothetical protein
MNSQQQSIKHESFVPISSYPQHVNLLTNQPSFDSQRRNSSHVSSMQNLSVASTSTTPSIMTSHHRQTSAPSTTSANPMDDDGDLTEDDPPDGAVTPNNASQDDAQGQGGSAKLKRRLLRSVTPFNQSKLFYRN